MPLLQQWELLQELSPLLPAISSTTAAVILKGAIGRRQFLTMLGPLVQADEAALDRMMKLCIGACEVQAEEAWGSVGASTLGIAKLLQIAALVIDANLGPMFALERPKFMQSSAGVTYDPVTLPKGLAWLWRPVDRGYFQGESLFNGTLRIEHIAMANDALDVRDENEARARRAAEKK